MFSSYLLSALLKSVALKALKRKATPRSVLRVCLVGEMQGNHVGEYASPEAEFRLLTIALCSPLHSHL